MLSKIIERFFSSRPAVKVLVVCLENVCRSPIVAGRLSNEVLQHGLEKYVKIDSAGARVSMPGSKPDIRALKVVKGYGFDIDDCRARQITSKDFLEYDLILAVDKQVLKILLADSSEVYHDKIKLLMEFVCVGRDDIPDPYFGNEKGFTKVVELIESVSSDLINKIKINFASKINRK